MADPEGKILSGYGVRWPLLGFARRVTYVIGPDRRVRQVIQAERDAEKHVREACAFVVRPPS